jgi:hypothetical protein
MLRFSSSLRIASLITIKANADPQVASMVGKPWSAERL